jgi:hypothetical protein
LLDDGVIIEDRHPLRTSAQAHRPNVGLHTTTPAPLGSDLGSERSPATEPSGAEVSAGDEEASRHPPFTW